MSLIKLTGAVLLMAAGLLLGRGQTAAMWDKALAFRDMMRIVSLLDSGLAARRPLRGLCLELGREPGRAGEFFRILGLGLVKIGQTGSHELWEECSLSVFGGVLSRRECALFDSMGASIHSGQSISPDARRCLDGLECMARKAEERASRDERVYTGLGMALGMALSIILV